MTYNLSINQYGKSAYNSCSTSKLICDKVSPNQLNAGNWVQNRIAESEIDPYKVKESKLMRSQLLERWKLTPDIKKSIIKGFEHYKR